MKNANLKIAYIDKSRILPTEEELSARVGRRVRADDPELLPIIRAVVEASEPRMVYLSCKVKITDGGVDLGFGEISSLALRKFLSGTDSAFLFAVTLGIEVDRLIKRMSIRSSADGFLCDAIASAVAERAADLAEQIVLGGERGSRFSPGYGDFPLECQRPLLAYLNSDKTVGISLTASTLMVPMKSVSAVARKGEARLRQL